MMSASNAEILAVEAARDTPDRAPAAFALALQVDVCGCDPDRIDDQQVILEWVDRVVELTGMTRFGEPISDYFGENDVAGWTIIQRIMESLISFHAARPTKYGHAAILDVVSCKTFKPKPVVEFSVEHFHATSAVVAVRERRASAQPGIFWLTPEPDE